MSTFDLLIKGARVVDAKNHRDEITDVGIKGGKIAAVAPNLAPSEASEVMQAQGLLLLPGLIDSHVHLGISACGFKMVAAAGVTTCLDMSGTSDDLARIAKPTGLLSTTAHWKRFFRARTSRRMILNRRNRCFRQ